LPQREHRERKAERRNERKEPPKEGISHRVTENTERGKSSEGKRRKNEQKKGLATEPQRTQRTQREEKAAKEREERTNKRRDLPQREHRERKAERRNERKEPPKEGIKTEARKAKGSGKKWQEGRTNDECRLALHKTIGREAHTYPRLARMRRRRLRRVAKRKGF
jgi:hypothetical protein